MVLRPSVVYMTINEPGIMAVSQVMDYWIEVSNIGMHTKRPPCCRVSPSPRGALLREGCSPLWVWMLITVKSVECRTCSAWKRDLEMPIVSSRLHSALFAARFASGAGRPCDGWNVDGARKNWINLSIFVALAPSREAGQSLCLMIPN